MSEYGLKVWDAQGGVIFSGADETMRIVDRVQVRIGAGQSGTHTISVPKARVGMYALVQPLVQYTAWGTYTGNKRGTRASIPSVRVIDGGIQLYGPSRSTWNGTVDVILVAT